MKKTLFMLVKKIITALNGILTTFKEEITFRIEILIAIIAIVIGILLHISLINWIVLTIIIILVLGMELINSSIENLLDLISYTYNINIKKIKDAFASAILIFSIGSVIIGCLIFIPAIIHYH